MNRKMINYVFVSIFVGLLYTGCGRATPAVSPSFLIPTPSFTVSDTPTTVSDTPTIVPLCFTSVPEYLNPRPASRAGWCEINFNHDLSISYPGEWKVSFGGGVVNRYLQFDVEISGQERTIGVSLFFTDLPIEEADQYVIPAGPDSAPIPLITDDRIISRTFLKTGKTTVLVLVTQSSFGITKSFLWLDQGYLLVFQYWASVSGFYSEETATLLSDLEEVVSTTSLIPNCATDYTRLHTGMYAKVTPGGTLPNLVRSGPSTSDETISRIYSGTIVQVQEGPICADGLVFWKVYNTSIPGNLGWTAEGDFTNYYLEPYNP